MTQSLKSKIRNKNIKQHVLKEKNIAVDDINVSFSYEIMTKNKSALIADIEDNARPQITQFLKELGAVFFVFDFKVKISIIENNIINLEKDKKFIIDISIFASKGRPTYKNSLRLGVVSFENENKRFLIQEINSINELDFSSMSLMFQFSYYHPAYYMPMGDDCIKLHNDFVLFNNAKLKIFEDLSEIGIYLEDNQIGLKEEDYALEWNRYHDLSYLNIDFMLLFNAKQIKIVYIKDEDEYVSEESLKKCLKIQPHISLDKKHFLSYIYENNFLLINKLFDKEDFVEKFELTMETYKTIKY